MYHHPSALSSDTQLTYLDYRVESPHLHYSRLALSPIVLGQANVIATAIRQALLSEIRCACITKARFPGGVHEYSTLPGVREPIHDILSNLRQIVLQTDTYKAQTGYLSFHGPGQVTAACLELPSSIQIVDKTQHIAQVESGSQLKIELTVERPERTARSYTRHEIQLQDSTFLIDARTTPVKSVSYNIYSIGGGPRLQELLMFEIWTDGSMTPEQMFHDAACYWTSLLQPLLGIKTTHNSALQQGSQPSLLSYLHPSTACTDSEKSGTLSHLPSVGIEELLLPTRVLTCLRKAGLHTVAQLAACSQEDLLQLRQLGKASTALVVTAFKQQFGIHLPLSHH